VTEKGPYTVSEETYKKYKDYILKHSNASQRFVGGTIIERRGKSIAELAQELGISERDVEEIRCIAKREAVPLSLWTEAEEFKRQKAREFFLARRGRKEQADP
jgi:hypothetical protein